ncbi:MAG: 30S ribosomal protein S4 [Candidatus Roizmanbacteria bacterium GW2011_GWC2_37_13]|uniref:Small ribosomal subunit protein uS4 n=1 Tax=Candidatus Roizmanbacteria bacterium GW2011_GWC2_37_13 TaxID=1618486 RepID=A0A0G0G9H1_9BACT|nr:MAG: ribosomal protein S4, small subunit ribosomal protein S4 [Candidatus Roizmanbacteria bacterium GW2011_GWC1_37_12]KKQ26617.1 MAG: 30S ribosomal protein S4 [Candidatus Roizmanbacteria bacterium GW2011_GWC2_37_13]
MRYTGPKNRIARREGTDLGLKTPGSKSHARLLNKLNVLPGQHGVRTRRKISERGLQLREKQKLRFIFGLSEKQLKNYFKKSVIKKGNTALYLSQFLESRLDNIVYRLGFAPTRASARQLITHGHIAINDKKLTIPSYQLQIGQKVSFLNEKTLKIPYIEKTLANKDVIIPIWLEKKAVAGKLTSVPLMDELSKQLNLRLIIEYYSR